MTKVSEYDIQALAKLRQNVDSFIEKSAQRFSRPNTTLLDIAPQDHAGAAPFFKESKIHTLDINPASGATYIADLCAKAGNDVPTGFFDFIICTEVLEHTLQPFHAVENILKFLKPSGLVFVSTPFNFRIHGPLPDCWRFTEHGLRALFSAFEIIEMIPLESERFLMPTQYTLIAKKPPS